MLKGSLLLGRRRAVVTLKYMNFSANVINGKSLPFVDETLL